MKNGIPYVGSVLHVDSDGSVVYKNDVYPSKLDIFVCFLFL